MIVFASMILEAWKFDSEPIENQLEFEAPDFWLTLERADVAERTERPDSELIEDKAEIEKFKLMILIYTKAVERPAVHEFKLIYEIRTVFSLINKPVRE